jgi:hypothetical protein
MRLAPVGSDSTARFVAYCVIVLLLFGGLVASRLSAQSATTGALTVIVKDNSGAVVPGAVITVSNSSGVTRSNQTNETEGSYTFTLLPPDNYKVTVTSPGFNTFETPSVTVDVTQTATFNAMLQVGTQTQEVQVTANATVIQTESTEVGGVVGQTAIESLPLVTRNYLQIMNLAPGVSTDVSNSTAVGLGLQNIFVNGKDNTDSTFQLNGVDISGYVAGGEGTGTFGGSSPLVSPDALQEFTVLTSNYDASYGKHSGANVNVVTKSGTNTMHGTAFEYLRNTVLNANTFFLNNVGHPRGVLNQNQYGGTLGGPIKKDKLFYFVSYQGTSQKNGVAAGASSNVTVPEQLSNDRSLLTLENEFCSGNPINAAPSGPGYPYAHTFGGGQQVTCPSGGAAGQGTVAVPVDTPGGLSSVAYNILNLKLPNGTYAIPTPQRIITSGTNLIGTAALSIPASYWDKQALADVDYTISPRNALGLRYFYDISDQVLPFTGTATQTLTGGQNSSQGSQVLAAKVTTQLSANVVNQATVSHFYLRSTFNTLDTTTDAQIGIAPPTPTAVLTPQMAITSLFGLFGSQFDGGSSPSYYNQVQDQVSWQHGRHSISAGFNSQWIRMVQCSCSKSRGNLIFQSFADFLLGESAAENGTGFSNVYQSQDTIQPINSPNNFQIHDSGIFAQDDIKINQRLTLNLGLRWEYLGTFRDRNPLGGTSGDFSIAETLPVPPAGGTYVGWTVAKDYNGPALPAGVTRRPRDLFTNGLAPLDDWAPRVGIAWQPFGNRLVFRAGGGIFYDMFYGDQLIQVGGDTPPNAAMLNYTGTGNGLATFSTPFNPPVAANSWAWGIRTQTSSLVLHGIDPNLITPRTFSWNSDIQYQLTSATVVDIGYVGNRDEYQAMQHLENIPTLASPTNPLNCSFPSGCLYTNTTLSTAPACAVPAPPSTCFTSNAALRVPVLGIGVADAQTINNDGDASYNSLQLSVQQKLSRGIQFQASYTWGRCFNDMIGASSGGAGLLNTSNDPSNLRQMRGPCDYLRPQRFVTNFLYQLPGSKSDNRLLSKATSGWAVSGVVTGQGGYPLTFTDTRGGAVYGNPDVGTAQTGGASRAQFCPGEGPGNVPTLGDTVGRLNKFFNNAGVFCAVPVIGAVTYNGINYPGGTGYGNSGRGIALGPGQFNWDMSLVKKTQVGGLSEDATLEFRSEFFNLFNHPQFANPVTNVASSTFGVITATNTGPRVIQFALRYAF